MPSPFPGMDPYLEHPARWISVHNLLITAIGTRLNTLLPPQYVATFGERLYVVEAGREVAPDVFVIQRPAAPPAQSPAGEEADGGVAVASDAPWTITLGRDEAIREPYINIVAADEESRVITTIEVLSPSNKAAGSKGRRLYRQKQQEVLASSIHLLEIDLLRSGEHTIAAPIEALVQRGYWDSLVCLSRADQRDRRDVWAIRLRERLPTIRVPLGPDDSDLSLELQAIFDRIYDEGAFPRRIDYHSDPPLPLRAEDAEWADTLLRGAKLRD